MKKALLSLTALVAAMAAFALEPAYTAQFELEVLAGGESIDNIFFSEAPSFTDGFDNMYDAYKFAAGSDTLVWSVVGTDTLSAVARPNLVGTFFTLQANAATNYQLVVKIYVEKADLALLDHSTQQQYNLVDGDTISFTQTANTRIDNRFEIVKGSTTNVVNVNANVNANGKLIRNGEFIIMKEGRKYNAQGTRL